MRVSLGVESEVVLSPDIVRRAVRNLDEIVKTDHIDCFFVAPSDLATSMGHIGNPGHPVRVEGRRPSGPLTGRLIRR